MRLNRCISASLFCVVMLFCVSCFNESSFLHEGNVYKVSGLHDLKGDTCAFDAHSVLNVHDGVIRNSVLVGEHVRVRSNENSSFENVRFPDSWRFSVARPEWFGAKGDGVTDDRESIRRCLACADTVLFSEGKRYLINSRTHSGGAFYYSHDLVVDGNNATLVVNQGFYEGFTGGTMVLFYEKFQSGIARSSYRNLNVEVNLTDTYAKNDGNFYVFRTYAQNTSFENVNVTNLGRKNNVNVITVESVDSLSVKGCRFDNCGGSKRGGMIWLMMMEKLKSDVSKVFVSDCKFIKDSGDEFICLSSHKENKQDCRIKFSVDNCSFESKNRVRGANFFILYDYREDANLNYSVEGKMRGCSFVSKRCESDPLSGCPLLVPNKGKNINAQWNITFEKCDIKYENDYVQYHGYEGKWHNIYFVGVMNAQMKDPDKYRVTLKDCNITTQNGVLDGYRGGFAGTYTFDNCNIKCAAMRLGNANPDLSTANVTLKNCKVESKFPYSCGGNERWHSCDITSDGKNFFISFFPTKRNVKKFTDCTFNKKKLVPDVKYDGENIKKAKYCFFPTKIYKNQVVPICGITTNSFLMSNVKVEEIVY